MHLFFQEKKGGGGGKKGGRTDHTFSSSLLHPRELGEGEKGKEREKVLFHPTCRGMSKRRKKKKRKEKKRDMILLLFFLSAFLSR